MHIFSFQSSLWRLNHITLFYKYILNDLNIQMIIRHFQLKKYLKYKTVSEQLALWQWQNIYI